MSRNHIRNLDAVRAIAILLVISFHARYLAFGWIGVWVFFVLSGFLITRSLIALAHEPFTRGLGIFYARRSLRIWPAYYVYIASAALALFVGGLPELRTQLPYAALYIFNLIPLFGHSAGGRVFSHLWSLAIEEQYYLVIAPVVLLLGRERCIPFFVAGVLLAPGMRDAAYRLLLPHYGAPGAAELVKLLTPLQFDSFMLGGLLALREDLITRLPAARLATTAGILAAAASAALAINAGLLATAGRLQPDSTSMDFVGMATWRLSATSLGIAVDARENGSEAWLYTVLAVASFALIACVVFCQRSTCIPLLNPIGRVSYGMYLYHMPLVSVFDRVMQRIAVPKHSLAGVGCLGVLVAVVWGISELSFRFLEQPFLRLKNRCFEPAAGGDRADISAADGAFARDGEKR